MGAAFQGRPLTLRPRSASVRGVGAAFCGAAGARSAGMTGFGALAFTAGFLARAAGLAALALVDRVLGLAICFTLSS